MKAKTNHRAGVLAALAAGGLLAAPALAQQESGSSTFRRPVSGSGDRQTIRPSETYVGISPDTTAFTFKTSTRNNQNGLTQTNTTTKFGVSIFADKIYFLRPERNPLRRPTRYPQNSAVDIGGWYWHALSSGATNDEKDRLAVYLKYLLDERVGAQLSVGGNSHRGLYEYYGFGLYNLTTAGPRSPVGVQIGLGPYVPRSSIGHTGFTGLFLVSYKANPQARLSYSASVWYVKYKAVEKTLGFTTNDETTRYFLGVSYRL